MQWLGTPTGSCFPFTRTVKDDDVACITVEEFNLPGIVVVNLDGPTKIIK